MIRATRDQLRPGVVLLDRTRGVRAVVKQVSERHGIRVIEDREEGRTADRTYTSAEIEVGFFVCGPARRPS